MKYTILAFALFFFGAVQSQILEPVKWSTSVEKVSNKEYVLVATAIIEPHWHLYSQNVPEDGPVPTVFTFINNGSFLKKGNTSEDKGLTVNDPVFEMQIKYFENKATFRQTVRLKNETPLSINGKVEFMVCDDTRCLPPTEIDLVFTLK
ncbi:thiol:disulfide interchange protein DsbD [Leeuwenhoekiella aestuarii]|uniref:Thiol:disulfide interchange protein DsbD n=1 Tax=Leeuwenhoekiella aestuarii TaxID=2249426 RepID=A0A4Q0NNI0_9FLAO|nr:protein-disulfide reductase DsbD domain-containing protein [Leeuwenhoekiella aestuarii]RXG11392.1 thiol:disulfide interchange protein DsbD [Leeuwenhoekiella aestuarii]RXG12129.1 thiol:disulfide interchange protein DsbD [Leeuwenhoekiella aestuarii]